MTLNYLFAYGAYLLGAGLFLLDVIGKYQKIADANPDKTIVFNGKVFWKKEWINIARILLLGVATMILLIPLQGINVDFKNAAGNVMFSTSVKVILMPLYLIFGWSGGKATLALAGRYKQQLYEQVGITEKPDV